MSARDQLSMEIVEEKPPYRLPTMDEVRAVPDNGLRVVSTFSGCGGSCMGFRMAGYKVLWASEFVPAAAETYRANWPDTYLDTRDIREVAPEEILKVTGLERGQLDVFEGSPPCSSFSLAGNREKDWGKVKKYSDVEQRTDDLFFEYTRLLDGLRPRVFVAENVPGLAMGDARSGKYEVDQLGVDGSGTGAAPSHSEIHYDAICKALSLDGAYVVWAKVLNAARLGVPQNRRRLIFIGVRRDQGRLPAYPDSLPYTYSIRDALGDVRVTGTEKMVKRRMESGWGASTLVDGEGFDSDAPSPTLTKEGFAGGNKYEFEVTEISVNEKTIDRIERRPGGRPYGMDEQGKLDLDLPLPIIDTVGISSQSKDKWNVEETSIERYAIGEEWDKLEPGEASEKYFNLIKPDPDKPSPTITQTGGTLGAASVTHPTQKRKFTIAELRLLSGFPADFILTGSWNQQWERIGRAVPPPMMAAVASTVRDEVLT